ncbi:(Fe-S)-binding protein [Crateriforma conspicua]|uniref:(Fe-S)-binding protein n=1 Tax=Crateriforma conspicua TaxID=2527996 RepID=UPI001189E4E0|nr:(Fe-S)-binding protein [Crateriforma conspicua]QDV62808.1 Lactate utilization protein A [Crateriforma conspicua]
MTVALFVPCYIDQFFPQVAVATLELLESLGLDVVFPDGQTCCGQPMANTGCNSDTAPVARRFVELFTGYDAVICPSGSCTAMVRHHYAEYFADDDPAFTSVRDRTFELCEYIHDVHGGRIPDVCFPHRVSVHQSCHGLRELGLGSQSERMVQRPDKVAAVLNQVQGIELMPLTRVDECCGFGGTFAVNEADVSAAMGRDRIADHSGSGSEVIVSADMSCLMHLQGILRRQQNRLQVMHVSEVLVGRELETAPLAAAQRS